VNNATLKLAIEESLKYASRNKQNNENAFKQGISESLKNIQTDDEIEKQFIYIIGNDDSSSFNGIKLINVNDFNVYLYDYDDYESEYNRRNFILRDKMNYRRLFDNSRKWKEPDPYLGNIKKRSAYKYKLYLIGMYTKILYKYPELIHILSISDWYKSITGGGEKYKEKVKYEIGLNFDKDTLNDYRNYLTNELKKYILDKSLFDKPDTPTEFENIRKLINRTSTEFLNHNENGYKTLTRNDIEANLL